MMNTVINTLPGLGDIVRTRLENGIVLLCRSNFNSPSVVINGFLQTGSLNDPAEKLGLADFVSAGLMRGTANRSFQEFYEELESAGASLAMHGHTHTTGFNGRALSEDLELLLDLLLDAMLFPTFPADEIEILRGQLLTGLALRAQNTGHVASMAFDQLVYKGHPYSLPDDGYPETIQSITREDLVEFHKKFFGPQGMVISIVGAVEPQRVVDLFSSKFDSWENLSQPDPVVLPALQPINGTQGTRIEIPGKYQADIVMGAAGPERKSVEYHAGAIGNNILGQFGLMGRIGEVVREQHGLAYYASSSLSGGVGPGPWLISAGVDPQNVNKTIELIRSEIERFTTSLVEKDELFDSKANFIGRLPLSLETNSGVAAGLTHIERYQLGLDYYQHYAGFINAVTREQVLETAAKHLSTSGLGIAVAGPDSVPDLEF